MSRFLVKTIVFRTSSLVPLQNPSVSSLRIRWFSITSKHDKRDAFVVSYLENSLGFSPKTALSISKFVKFDSPDKPDKAVEFFRNFGFTQTQVSRLVKVFPGVLVSDTKGIILPKLEFLKAKGVSEPEMAKILSSFPCLLRTSLTDQIIPSYDYLRNLFQSNERTVGAVRRYPDILGHGFKYVVANADVLREHGMPDFKIAYWLENQPRSFVFRLCRFRKVVEEVAKMGFDASTTSFAIAVRVFLGLSRPKWESKVEMYRKCGFSEEEVSKVFRRFPYSMSYSEEKIMASMDFFVKEMRWRPSLIALYPQVIGLSLKKRIIPRCSVFKALLSKGLVNEKRINLIALLSTSKERFLEKYVERYYEEAPELLELYEEKLSSLSNRSLD